MKQDFQINFLINTGLKPDNKLLDIGCGTLRGGIPIIKYLNHGNYYGIEVRENVLNEGKKELKEEGLAHKDPKLITFEDFSSLIIEAKFDIIFAFSVLIHLDDQIAGKCFNFINEHLSEDGCFLANVNLTSYKDGNWQGFPVVYRSLEFYENLATKSNLTMRKIGDLKELGHISNQGLADEQVMLEFKKKKHLQNNS